MEGGGLWGFGDLDFEATRAMAEREDAKPRTVTMQIYDSYLLKARQDLAKLFRSSARKPFSPSRIPCKPESPELGCLFFLSSESQALDVKLPYAGEDARICFWPGGGGGGAPPSLSLAAPGDALFRCACICCTARRRDDTAGPVLLVLSFCFCDGFILSGGLET